VPAHQAAGLHQPGGAQCSLADDQARAEADSASELVRLGFQDCAQLDRCRSDGHACAAPDSESCQQRRIDGSPERVVSLRQRCREIARGLQRDRAE